MKVLVFVKAVKARLKPHTDDGDDSDWHQEHHLGRATATYVNYTDK